MSSSPFKLQPLYFVLFCLFMAGCLDPYQPPEIQGELNLLVVDGFINASNQSARVKLTTSLPLDTTATPQPIDHAQVTVEGEDGTAIPLPGKGGGQYEASSIAWNMDAKYRLNITLTSGENYLSDLISLTRTPDIDSVTYREGKDALNMYVNTHESSGNARYYKWEYDETWEYVASFFSNYKLIGGEAYDRTIDERIYFCWSGSPSTKILVDNTLKLSDDVVSNFLLTAVPAGSVQLSRRYSINVRQRTLTEAEYEFWTSLKKTTESVGGLFDPLPYAVVGNLHGTNNNNVVLGYFGGGEVKEQRIFVGLSELPVAIAAKTMRVSCQEQEDIKPLALADLKSMSSATTVLIDAIYVPFIGIVGYTYSYPTCADCRIQGGTTKKPDFW